MAFTISIGGDERPLTGHDRDELATYIVDVACSRAEFLILTNEKTSEYIQCADAYGRLVVERRDRRGAAFVQSRIVRKAGSREKLPPRVEGYEGYEKREVLDVEEVVRLFENFMAGAGVEGEFEAVDVTQEYAEAAQAEEEQRSEAAPGIFGRIKKLFGR